LAELRGRVSPSPLTRLREFWSRLGIGPGKRAGTPASPKREERYGLTALLRAWLFFFVGGNRLQIFGLKDLAAIQAPDVIDPVAAIEQFGSLVLATLLSEIKLILECMKTVSNAKKDDRSVTET
jgi:hypothetical protein